MATSPGLSSRSARLAEKLSPTQLYSGRPAEFSNGIMMIVSVATPAEAIIENRRLNKQADKIRLIMLKIDWADRSDTSTLNGPNTHLLRILRY